MPPTTQYRFEPHGGPDVARLFQNIGQAPSRARRRSPAPRSRRASACMRSMWRSRRYGSASRASRPRLGAQLACGPPPPWSAQENLRLNRRSTIGRCGSRSRAASGPVALASTDSLADFLASPELGRSNPTGPRKAQERSWLAEWFSFVEPPVRITAQGRRRNSGNSLRSPTCVEFRF
jgi:hypothetical protein